MNKLIVFLAIVGILLIETEANIFKIKRCVKKAAKAAKAAGNDACTGFNTFQACYGSSASLPNIAIKLLEAAGLSASGC
jgi:3-hydroxy-3-methylglutaryl CoA synthase